MATNSRNRLRISSSELISMSNSLGTVRVSHGTFRRPRDIDGRVPVTEMPGNSKTKAQPSSSNSPVSAAHGTFVPQADVGGEKGAELQTDPGVQTKKQRKTEEAEKRSGGSSSSRKSSLWDRIKNRRCRKTPLACLATRNTRLRFRALCNELVRDGVKRVDIEAAKQIRNSPDFVTPPDLIGSVPGVEVGDEFIYRTEISLIGLHKPSRAEVHFIRQDEMDICTSIVASGGGGHGSNTADGLIFIAHEGSPSCGKKGPVDQTLQGGILALKNSESVKNPVRVIRANREVGDGGKDDLVYIYDGLYEVESCLHKRAKYGKMVYEFTLVRRPRQPSLTKNQWVKLGRY